MFATYLELGLTHILDLKGVDHLLFLAALVLTYRLRQWRSVLILATAFTLGHSITLALASLDVISVDSHLVEIFIAGSIAMTAAYNIWKIIKHPENYHQVAIVQSKADLLDEPIMTAPMSRSLRLDASYAMALLFGLIHGLGFSNFFKAILGKDAITFPLFAFNVGVEIAQVIIVIIVLLLSAAIAKIFPKGYRIYLLAILGVILLWSLKMVIERL